MLDIQYGGTTEEAPLRAKYILQANYNIYHQIFNVKKVYIVAFSLIILCKVRKKRKKTKMSSSTQSLPLLANALSLL